MKVLTISVMGLALLTAPAAAQQQQGSPPPMVGTTGSPLGGWRGASNNPGTGTGDMPGMWTPSNANSSKGMPKGPYGLELAQRIHDAQELVDQVNGGKVLTPKDSGHIRDLMREDFFAWDKQYDLPQAGYRAERDKWIVDTSALTPDQWAKHRLEWLEAERDWILSHGG